jgi:hypothetical protein
MNRRCVAGFSVSGVWFRRRSGRILAAHAKSAVRFGLPEGDYRDQSGPDSHHLSVFNISPAAEILIATRTGTGWLDRRCLEALAPARVSLLVGINSLLLVVGNWSP